MGLHGKEFLECSCNAFRSTCTNFKASDLMPNISQFRFGVLNSATMNNIYFSYL